MKKIAILGSTGSIGTQALEVISEHPEKLTAEVLIANNNFTLLAEQIVKFEPNIAVIVNEEHYDTLLKLLPKTNTKLYAGMPAAIDCMCTDSVDFVLTAIVGSAGLLPTIKAIEAGKPIGLANKETLVVAGELITKIAKDKAVNIYPVDSEHSAIFQCLAGEWQNPIEKIYLTASGGPFRGKSLKELAGVGRKEALNHPNWEMGAKITIDSATLMNKGLEVIEAKWLFSLNAEQIDVIVHPESIIHSIVQFKDGSMKAQLGLPDMKLPIQYAMAYPERLPNSFERFDFKNYASLNFEKPDTSTFKCLQLAFDALSVGGTASCVLNASNEIAVQAFLDERISFLKIGDINQHCLETFDHIKRPNLEELLDADQRARMLAQAQIKKST